MTIVDLPAGSVRATGRHATSMHRFDPKVENAHRDEEGGLFLRVECDNCNEFWLDLRVTPEAVAALAAGEFYKPDDDMLEHDGFRLLVEDRSAETFPFNTEAEVWACIRGMAFVLGNSDLFLHYRMPARRDDGKWVVEVTLPEC